MSYREPARRFEDLIAWQKAHQVVLDTYRLTGSFPKSELYGLTSQMRRAAVSVPANIAEGFTRMSKADKAKFMNIAHASLEELRYFFILAKDLSFTQENELNEPCLEVGRLLASYTRSLKRQ